MCLFVCLSVCPLIKLLENLWTDFQEICGYDRFGQKTNRLNFMTVADMDS